jgi:hypothetical protein
MGQIHAGEMMNYIEEALMQCWNGLRKELAYPEIETRLHDMLANHPELYARTSLP